MANYRGSKFEPLTSYLEHTGFEEVTLSFNQIEEILGVQLCPSAREYIAYWHPSKTHYLPLAWEAANYELANLDMKSERVTLHRKR